MASSAMHGMEATVLSSIVRKMVLTLEDFVDVDIPGPERAVLEDLYFQVLSFCKQCDFNKTTTSLMLSIVKHIHQANIDSEDDNMEQWFQMCNRLLLYHAVRGPSFHLGIFNFQEVMQIFKFIHNTYCRNFHLYKCLFTPQRTLDLSLRYSGVPESTAEESPDVGNDLEITGSDLEIKDSVLEITGNDLEITDNFLEINQQPGPEIKTL